MLGVLALEERTSNPKRAKRRSASCCPGPFHSWCDWRCEISLGMSTGVSKTWFFRRKKHGVETSVRRLKKNIFQDLKNIEAATIQKWRWKGRWCLRGVALDFRRGCDEWPVSLVSDEYETSSCNDLRRFKEVPRFIVLKIKMKIGGPEKYLKMCISNGSPLSGFVFCFKASSHASHAEQNSTQTCQAHKWWRTSQRSVMTSTEILHFLQCVCLKGV